MPNAARMGDKVKQIGPHCHAPIHPAAPVPTPVPHPALPMEILTRTAATVLINERPAALLSSGTVPSARPSCVPAGPGIIAKGSTSVFIQGLPAARVGDMTAHGSCVAIIPSPVGKVEGPGSTNVKIGG